MVVLVSIVVIFCLISAGLGIEEPFYAIQINQTNPSTNNTCARFQTTSAIIHHIITFNSTDHNMVNASLYENLKLKCNADANGNLLENQEVVINLVDNDHTTNLTVEIFFKLTADSYELTGMKLDYTMGTYNPNIKPATGIVEGTDLSWVRKIPRNRAMTCENTEYKFNDTWSINITSIKYQIGMNSDEFGPDYHCSSSANLVAFSCWIMGLLLLTVQLV
jgi:hypothetical protein